MKTQCYNPYLPLWEYIPMENRMYSEIGCTCTEVMIGQAEQNFA